MDNSILIYELKALREYVELNGYDTVTRVESDYGVYWPNEFMCHACEINGWEIAQKFIQRKVINHPDNVDHCTVLRRICGSVELTPEEYQIKRLQWLDELINELEKEQS